MWLKNDSPSELLLNPAFLKFLGICVLIAAMLDSGSEQAGLMKAQQVALLWPVLGIQTILWFTLMFFAVNALYLRGLMSSIYTPLIVVPQLVLTQITTYIATSSLYPDSANMVIFSTGEMLRDVVLMVIYDVLFSSYVVHRHPSFSSVPVYVTIPSPTAFPMAQAANTDPIAQKDALIDQRPIDQIAATLDAPPPKQAADQEPILPVPAPPAADIQIGNKVFAIDSIEMIQSEDHYLAVYTATRKDLVRARMSETVAKLDILHGVQINRSTWVAFSFVKTLVKTNATIELHLTNGTIETVAAVRRHAVNAAYELFLRQKGQ